MQRARYPCRQPNSKTIRSVALCYLSPVFLGKFSIVGPKCVCKVEEEGFENAWNNVCRTRDACDRALLRQQDQHLVRRVHKPLPTKSELEFEVTTETAQSDDEKMFLTPLLATEVVPASVPDDCAISDELLCRHGEKRPRCEARRSQTETPQQVVQKNDIELFS